MLPEILNIDTIIMCGLHAKHPDYTKNAGIKIVNGDLLNVDKEQFLLTKLEQ